MKYTVAFIIASLAALAASRLRQEKDPESASSESGPESVEDRYWIEGPVLFELTGNLKTHFALHAALTDPSRNLICSPISALLPLGKLVLGTDRGRSRNELLDAMGYSKNKVKRRLRSVIHKLKYLPGVTLTVFNSLYVSNTKQLQSKYVSATMSVFKSTCQKLDFQRPAEAAAVINSKVKETTHGKITQIIGPGDISPSTSLIVVNAIYFMGLWKEPFKQVALADFHTPDGVRKVPMMTRRGYYNYVQSDTLRAQIIEIPYQGDKASFVIVLPIAQNSLALLLRQLKVAPDMLNQAMSNMKQRNVKLSMPKFRIESRLNLNVLYEKIGVRSIFLNDQSDLTRIINGEKIWVSSAVQKAYIEVTERGTEAAAATGSDSAAHIQQLLLWDKHRNLKKLTSTKTAVLMPVRYDEPQLFIADRPFLFFVKADRFQLFAGIYTGLS